jgi:hypothetical protein
LEVSGQLHAPAALPPGKSSRYLLYRRLGGPQSRSGRHGEVLIPSRNVHGGSKNNTKKLNQDSRYPDRDSKSEPSEYSSTSLLPDYNLFGEQLVQDGLSRPKRGAIPVRKHVRESCTDWLLPWQPLSIVSYEKSQGPIHIQSDLHMACRHLEMRTQFAHISYSERARCLSEI